jgi:hypothetical protein
LPAAVFLLKAQAGEPAFRPATLEPFACPVFEVNVGALGNPRDAARKIAAR